MTAKPGRNDPCHCGSGKKYKKCCAEKDQSAPRPIQTAPLYREALALYGKGDLVGAQKRFTEIVAADPRHADALCMQGVIEGRLGNFPGSAMLIRKAIEVDGNNAEFYYNLGLTLVGLNDQAGAAEAFSQAIRLNPKDSRYFNNLASLLLDQKQFEQAVPGLQRALELDPQNAEAWNNLGVALDNLGHFREAKQALERAIELAPNNASAHSNLGEVIVSLEGQAAALPHFERAVQLMPQHPAFRKNLSRALLAAGQTEQGFEDHDARLPLFLGTYARFPWARWQGEGLAGKTILVTPEQGVGDEIMFANCLPDLIAAASKVIVLCDPRLAALFARSFPDAIVLPNPKDNDTSRFDEYGPIDFQVAIGSLPRLFRKQVEDFPHYEDGFLVPDPARVEHWKARLSELGEGPKVGICWRSGYITAKRANKYSQIEEWGPVFAIPGVHFVNLQYDECSDELEHARNEFGVQVANFGGTEIDLKNDLDDCAALYKALDLVISPGTAVSALSGAIGVETGFIGGVGWVALGTKTHPWYPRATVIRPEHLVGLKRGVRMNLIATAVWLAGKVAHLVKKFDWVGLVRSWYEETTDVACIGYAAIRHAGDRLPQKAGADLLEIDSEHSPTAVTCNLRGAARLVELGQDAKAEQIIERLYRERRNLMDGYARLATVKFHRQDWAGAAEWYEKDHALGRLSPAHQVNLALARVWLDELELAKNLVGEAYTDNPELRDGYARLGMFVAERLGVFSPEGVTLIDMDRESGRMSPNMKLTASKYYIWVRRFHDAERLVEEAYAELAEAKDGYGRIATAALLIGEHDRAMRYWQKERELGRAGERTISRHDFMQRPEWDGGSGQVYVYFVPRRTEFEEIIPALRQLHARPGLEAMIEVPTEAVKMMAREFPRFLVSDGEVFGATFPSSIPDGWGRISYDRLVQEMTNTDGHHAK